MPYWRLFYHLVWGTKGREPIIGAGEEKIIMWSLRDTCNEFAVIPHAIGLMPDHVHLAISLPPKNAIATFVGRLKGASAHAVNHNDERSSGTRFAWQAEYGVLSFSEKALPDVIDYVQNQQSRHVAQRLWAIAECITDDQSTNRD